MWEKYHKEHIETVHVIQESHKIDYIDTVHIKQERDHEDRIFRGLGRTI